MADDKERAEKGLQRERVFAHKAEILSMLDQGARYITIKARLGLEDIPRTTFQYLVKRIRDEAAKRADRDAAIRHESRSPPSPFPATEGGVSTGSTPVHPATNALQPDRETPSEAGDAKTAKPARRKIRKGVVIPEPRDAQDLNLDPSKWKKS